MLRLLRDFGEPLRQL